MIHYEIKMTGGKHPVPLAVFEDGRYELAGTFLLAEARSFADEIRTALDAVCAGKRESSTFSGNAFSLAVSADKTIVTDDIRGEECVIGTREFREVVEAYCRKWEACCRAWRR